MPPNGDSTELGVERDLLTLPHPSPWQLTRKGGFSCSGVGSTPVRAGLGWGPLPSTHLQLLELLQLVAEVAGVLLQVVEVQLHVQAGDGGGLPRRRAGGRGWRGRGHRCPHATAAGGCGEGKQRQLREDTSPRGRSQTPLLCFPRKDLASPTPCFGPAALVVSKTAPSTPTPHWLQGKASPELSLSGMRGPAGCQHRDLLLHPPWHPQQLWGRGEGLPLQSLTR